ncbi:Squamous cell carcinoma antigen recognized by T-cells 3 [Trichoplax sp. H2]|nr:Squamous cell carcinoma antigen recognized by T-cells 3 [Trichoplax sp. H2]|eukprot:RDD39002.1 Squamous cell carcinoma antigen recognized by T-cells 3 [Trichoplax sp. H2]
MDSHDEVVQHGDDDDTNIDQEEDTSDSYGSSSSDTDDEEEGALAQRVDHLLSYLHKNEFHYDSYVELINLLRQQGDLVRLRSIRKKMNQLFPLTEDLWMQWVSDEANIAQTEEEKAGLVELLDKSIIDYLSVGLWQKYASYCITEKVGNHNDIRNIYERALTSVGLHLTKGCYIWDDYREYEINILNSMTETDDLTSIAKELLDQKDRITTLYKRQLAVPLLGMQGTWRDFESWMGKDSIDEYTKQLYEQAVEKLDQRMQYEDSLLSVESTLEGYKNYIEFEKTTNEPARIQCLYERSLRNHCLSPELWQSYTQYLDTKLKVWSIAVQVYERAIRNCPWVAALWHGYLRAQERAGGPIEKMRDTVTTALNCNLGSMENDLSLWLIYIDRLRRNIKPGGEDSEEITLLRDTFQAALNHIYNRYETVESIDYLQKYWAKIEARHFNNIEKCRQLREELLNIGHKRQASYWIEYIELERAYGDIQNCQKLFSRAIRAVNDDPEGICQAWLDFEREEGQLSDWDIANAKCQDQLQVISQKRAKAVEKEAEEKKKRKEEKERSKMQDRINRKLAQTVAERNQIDADAPSREKRKFDFDSRKESGITKKSRTDGSLNNPSRERERYNEKTSVFISNVPFSAVEDDIRSFFSTCGNVKDVRLVRAPNGKFKGYGYVEFEDELVTQEALKLDRNTIAGRPVYVSENVDKSKHPTEFKFGSGMDRCTLFVKNTKDISSDRLREVFNQFEGLRDIRCVARKSGRSRGFAYIEFSNEASAANAVKTLDNTEIDGVTISVAISNPDAKETSEFEKNRKPEIRERNESKNRSTSDVPTVTSRGRGRTGLSFMVPRSVKKNDSTTSESSNNSSSKLSNDDFRKMLTK